MALTSRQLDEMATILRDLNLVVYQMERSPQEVLTTDQRARLCRELDGLRHRLSDLSREMAD